MMNRSLSHSLPYLPRYHSVSPARSPRKYSSARSLSQPSQKVLYIEGERSKVTNHYRVPSTSPKPSPVSSTSSTPRKKSKIYIFNTKSPTPLYRISHSSSESDLNSSHIYRSLECPQTRRRRLEMGRIAAMSCEDIYHKGPYFPDATRSESGVSMGESESGADDDTASQISYGSSSAFFETTIDSEFDCVGDRTLDHFLEIDVADGKLSPAGFGGGNRGHGRHCDRGIMSPLSYADARKRELMNSPSWEFDKVHSKCHSLKVLIPGTNEHDHKQVRKDGVSTPLAQSTPHVSPRGFYGPKLSIKGSWNVDDPDTGLHEKTGESSGYSSFSENISNLHSSQSEVSPEKETMAKNISLFTSQAMPSREDFIDYHSAVPESRGIYIPPLESVIGREETEKGELRVLGDEEKCEGQWWAVYNIEAANARQEAAEAEGEQNKEASFDFNPRVKVVKPKKTGIPLISPGKYGQEKLKKSLSPPPENDEDDARRSSPPLLSLSPTLTEKLGKREEKKGVAEEEYKGEQPNKLLHMDRGDRNDVGSRPFPKQVASTAQVTRDDNLNDYSTCLPDMNSDPSHGHQNKSLATTADGVDKASTNNHHYPLGNLSMRGQVREADEEDGASQVGTKSITTTHHLNIPSGKHGQAEEPGVVVSHFGPFFLSLPVKGDTPSFQNASTEDRDACVSKPVASNEIQDCDRALSVCSSISIQTTSPRIETLCHEFEALNLNEVDLDATLVDIEEKTDTTLSKLDWTPEAHSGNVKVNINIDTGSIDGGGTEPQTAPHVENIDLSILSGNVGQEKTRQTSNMNRTQNVSNPHVFFCSTCGGKVEICGCYMNDSIDRIIIIPPDGIVSRGNCDGRNRKGCTDGTGYIRLVARAQMPEDSGREKRFIDEICDRDTISPAHSSITTHSDESRRVHECECSSLPHGEEQDVIISETSRNSHGRGPYESVNEGVTSHEWTGAENCNIQKSDILWQQEGFRPYYCDDKRSGQRGDESINSPATRGGQRGDKGIPQVGEKESTNTQKDGASVKGTRQTEDEFLLQRSLSVPHHSQTVGKGDVVDEEVDSSSQIVKQFGREETVTIERSVVTRSGSDYNIQSEDNTGSGVFDCVNYSTCTNNNNSNEVVIEEKVKNNISTPVVDYNSNNALDQNNKNKNNDVDNLITVSSQIRSSGTSDNLEVERSDLLTSEALNPSSSLGQLNEYSPFHCNTPYAGINPAVVYCPSHLESNDNNNSNDRDTPCPQCNMRGERALSSKPLQASSEFLSHSSHTTPIKTVDMGSTHSNIHSFAPVAHQNLLDNLQTQLSQISGVVGNSCSHSDLDQSSGVGHENTTIHHDTKHYHDHGKATHLHTPHCNDGVSRIIEHDSKHISPQPTHTGSTIESKDTKGNLSCGRGGVTGTVNSSNTSQSTSESQRYDSDYDYVTDPGVDSHSTQSTRHNHQHNLLKPGGVKSSSLWTLQEETESLLDGLSPKASPRRHFSTTDSEDNFKVSSGDGFDSHGFNIDENKNLYSSRSLNSAWGNRKRNSDSSDYDESDGHFTDSSGGRSNNINPGITSIINNTEMDPSGLNTHKFNNSQGADDSSLHVDSISNFYDFVNGLERGEFTFELANKSRVSSSVNGGNGITLPDTQQQVHSLSVPGGLKQSQACGANSHAVSSTSTSHLFVSSPNADVNRRHNELVSLALSSSLPFTNNEEILNSSIASSSCQSSYSNQDNQSEASSRLQALDLDLSRISSCTSPTPSDFSEASTYTCTGTAEIKKSLSVSFDDDYDMLPAPKFIPSSTPKQAMLKSVLKKSTSFDNKQQPSKHAEWVKQFDQIIDDFNNKTSPLGPDPDVAVLEEGKQRETDGAGSTCKDMYKLFTNDESEKKQNHVCIVEDAENIDTFRFKRFLKKSHTRRNKGKRIVRFLSRLGCVSESVQVSPDHGVCRKKARLDNGKAYSTDSMPIGPLERGPIQIGSTALHLHHLKSPTHNNNNDCSPTSSNQSLDSLRSRTDSAYSSVSESPAFNSPSSQKNVAPLSSATNLTVRSTLISHPDSAFSSISDTTGSEADSPNPFSPTLPEHSKNYSSDMLSALSDVFDQLDVCEEEIDQALLNRLRYGHRATAQDKKY